MSGQRSGVSVGGCPITHRPAESERPATGMARAAVLIYGVLAYLAFFAVFTYTIGFVTNVAVPRSIDNGMTAAPAQAVLINLGLLGVFAVQHSVMARPAFKRWWTGYVPLQMERSTYVLFASAAIALLCWQWRSIGTTVWEADSPAIRVLLTAVGWAGWVTVLASTFMIDHFELFGLRQVVRAWRSKPETNTGFRTVLLYRLVRHPLMLGFLVAFWSTPVMTAGHLLFAVVTTGYILVAVRLEERDLVAELGQPYRDYRQRVPMLLPRPSRTPR
jgi:methanethiol S-methyltransferase